MCCLIFKVLGSLSRSFSLLRRLIYYITSSRFCQQFFEIFLNFLFRFFGKHSSSETSKSTETSVEIQVISHHTDSSDMIFFCPSKQAKPAWNLCFRAFCVLLPRRVLVYNITFSALCQHVFSVFLRFGGFYINYLYLSKNLFSMWYETLL